MKVKELMHALAQCDPETEIKIAHIQSAFHIFNTEIDSDEAIISGISPDGNGEEFLIKTNYGPLK